MQRFQGFLVATSAFLFLTFLSGCPSFIPNFVFVSPGESTIQVGRNVKLTATGTIVQESYDWRSELPNIATVNEKGEVTGIAPGMAVITATGRSSGTLGYGVVIVLGMEEEFDTPTEVSSVALSPELGTPRSIVTLANGSRFILDDPAYIAEYNERSPDRSTKALPLDEFLIEAARMKQRPSQDRISLASMQTPIRNQQDRGTCVSHTVMAALEAAYNRRGVGPLNLSEQHFQHIMKTQWLHDFTADPTHTRTRNGWENQNALSGGNGVYGGLSFMTLYRVCTENEHSYRHSRIPGHNFGDYSSTNQPGDNPRTDWRDRSGGVDQAHVSSFNMIQKATTYQLPANYTFTPLPQPALEEAHYGVSSYITVPSNRLHDPIWYEQQIAASREILVGLNFRSRTENGILYPRDRQGDESLGAHAVLIVGYDRSDSDEPYFIVKNSWGESGFIKLSYDWLSTEFDGRITHAACITEVSAVDPQAFQPQLYLGRWKILYDGIPGTLDIHRSAPFFSPEHLGGQQDRRLGAFYNQHGEIFRVNGAIDADGRMEAYIDFQNPSLDYETRTGQRFVAHLNRGNARLIGGVYGPAGSASNRAFYATKEEFFTPIVQSSSLSQTSFLGRWRIESPTQEGSIEFRQILGNAFNGRYNRPDSGWITLDGIANSATRSVIFELPIVGGGRFEGFIHSNSPGIISGSFTRSGATTPMILVRTGPATETITITQPLNGAIFNQGATIDLRSTVEIDGVPLPSALVIWTRNGPYNPSNPSENPILSQSGLNGSTKLGAGSYDIYANLLSTDLVFDSVSISVKGPGDPTVTITSPANDSYHADVATSPPDVPVRFTATATSASGAQLNGNALVWSYRREGEIEWTNAGVVGRTVFIPLRDDNCGPTPYQVRLQATDASGNTSTAIIRVRVVAFFC